MVDRWTNPTTASLRGEDSRPLQQTFSSLSSYLGKLDDAIAAAAASGVSSLTAGTGIGLSGGTGAVTVSNTGVTSLAGTANQITVSAGTGGVTLSLPQNIHTGARPAFAGMDIGTTNLHFGADVRQMINLWSSDPNAPQYGIGVQGATQYFRSGTNFAWYTGGVHSNNVLDAGGGTRLAYLNSTDGFVVNKSIIGSHTLTSDYWRFYVTPNNYPSLGINMGEYYGRAAVRTGSGTLQLVSTGDIWFSIDNANRMGYLNTAGFYLEQGWFRPHGQTGIYFQSYGGGWWMTDTTWIRAYGDKNIYTAGEIRSNYPFSSNNTNNGANMRMISGNLTYFGWFGYYAQYVDSTHVKTFVIDHPTRPDNYLVHACAEGPTSDVFYRGEGQLQNGICVVTLPDYFEELTELEGRTIMVTPISDENGPSANLAAYEIQDGEFVVEQVGGFHVPYQRFWWRVDAVRKGTAFDVEPLKSETEVSGDGPYTYARKRAA
jgi:hypothetical protein